MMAELVVSPLRQINLVNSSLIPTREIFSARLIVAWVIIAAAAMAAVAWWAVIETRKISGEIAYQASRQAIERARTTPMLPSGEVLPTPQLLAAREQALRNQQALLETRRTAREALKRGMASDHSGPSALMRLIANSVPPEVWVTEVRVAGSRLDVRGKTLDSNAVNVWLERLRTNAYFAVKPVPAVRLERADVLAPPPARTLPGYTFAISATLTSSFADEGGRP